MYPKGPVSCTQKAHHCTQRAHHCTQRAHHCTQKAHLLYPNGFVPKWLCSQKAHIRRDGQLTVCPFLQWKWNSVTGFFHRFMQSDFNHFCSWAAFVVFVWRCNDSFSKDMNHSVADSALIWTILSAIFSGNPDLCHKNGEFVSIKVVYSRIVSQPILN